MASYDARRLRKIAHSLQRQANTEKEQPHPQQPGQELVADVPESDPKAEEQHHLAYREEDFKHRFASWIWLSVAPADLATNSARRTP